MTTLNEKTKRKEKNIQELETSLTSTNTDITCTVLEGRQKQTLEKIKSLEDQILDQDVFSGRENLRFFGLPKASQDAENSSEVLYKFFEDELNIENSRSIEFQRIHRLENRAIKTDNCPIPYISRTRARF